MTDETAPRPESNDASETPDAELARLQAENAELRDRVLRALAEADNARKRAERDAADARAYAVTSFARDLLNVADNLHRALEAGQPGDAGTLTEGVKLTAREFETTMARHGIVRIDPMGERFDPNLHQAMMEMEDSSVPAGTVVQVMQAGYTISGRVLRPALVAVSRGGPRLAAEPTAGLDKTA
ncbi:MAG TPA: nucleotide exchange factor GrpE [Hyphomicrobiales bacterium]|nr:nucleotide exchange factor GrpE [Hyphomicrobiales bacterium]